jgi:hypothetical protein
MLRVVCHKRASTSRSHGAHSRLVHFSGLSFPLIKSQYNWRIAHSAHSGTCVGLTLAHMLREPNFQHALAYCNKHRSVFESGILKEGEPQSKRYQSVASKVARKPRKYLRFEGAWGQATVPGSAFGSKVRGVKPLLTSLAVTTKAVET